MVLRVMLILLSVLMMTGCQADNKQTSEDVRYLTHIFRRSDSPLMEEEVYLDDPDADYVLCAKGVFRLTLEDDDTYTMIRTAKDGTERVIEDFLGFLSESGGSLAYVHSFAADDEGYLYITDLDRTLCVSENFDEIRFLTESCGYVPELQRGEDGGVYIIDIDYSEQAVLTPIGPNGADRENSYIIKASNIEKIDLGPGSTAYYLSEDKIYAWNPDTEPEIIMNIADSGFLYRYIDKMEVSSRERIVFRYEKAFSEKLEYGTAIYEKAPDIDLSRVQTITLATTENSSMLTKQITLFHAENPDIRIKLADYSEDGVTKFSTDIQTGKLKPDIYYGKTNEAQFGQYVDNGLYVDLYTMMEGESVYKKENLFSSIQRSYESSGELYGIPMNLEFTTVIANKAVATERTSWTAEEMLEISQSLPEGTCLFEWNRNDAVFYLLSAHALTGYIDKNAGTCTFDSLQFIRLIEFIKSMPETKDKIAVQYDYNDEEERIAVYREGKINARIVNTGAIDLIGGDFVYYSRENTTMIGFPVCDTQTQNGFLMKSDNPVLMIVNEEAKESAWEFLKSCTSYMDSGDIPIWKSVYNDLMIERSAFQQYFYTSGGMSSYVGDDPDYVMVNDLPGELIRWDSEYRDFIYDILDTAGAPVPVGGMYSQIAAIVKEEVSAYLADDSEVADCAGKIQSRAQVCMHEYLG